ncbi:MAG: peptidase U32 family protein [Candidatus Woesearchaeota archaeon]
MKNKVEIMAPAGSFECLSAAIKAGAGSVYFGVGQLNMRARAANNFTLKDLKKVSKICKEKGVKTYLTLNIVMYDEDLGAGKDVCDAVKKAGIDAIIASDISVIEYANSIGMEVHLSTQVNVSNTEAVRFYAKYADVIVLARELTLKQIKDICNKIKKEKIKGPSGGLVKIEIFVHGALCVSIAGKCYMSLANYNESANRGLCLQTCRRKYRVFDDETGDELVIDNNHVMSPKDLCTIGFIDRLIDSGVSIFKIEGRGRAADYVYTVTKVYSEAVESFYKKSYSKDKIKRWIKELETVYNRGFWHGGYYLGKKLGEWSGVYGSRATKEKVFVGVVDNYFSKNKVCEFKIQTGEVKVGDEIIITGATTGVVKDKVGSMRVDDKDVGIAKKGDFVTIPIKERLREKDKLFILVDRVEK